MLAKHEQIMEQIRDLLWTDPVDLLDDNRALLKEDFGQLGESTLANQEAWAALMEMSISATEHRRNRDSLYMNHALLAGKFQLPPAIDEEGSLHYRKC